MDDASSTGVEGRQQRDWQCSAGRAHEKSSEHVNETRVRQYVHEYKPSRQRHDAPQSGSQLVRQFGLVEVQMLCRLHEYSYWYWHSGTRWSRVRVEPNRRPRQTIPRGFRSTSTRTVRGLVALCQLAAPPCPAVRYLLLAERFAAANDRHFGQDRSVPTMHRSLPPGLNASNRVFSRSGYPVSLPTRPAPGVGLDTDFDDDLVSSLLSHNPLQTSKLDPRRSRSSASYGIPRTTLLRAAK